MVETFCNDNSQELSSKDFTLEWTFVELWSYYEQGK
jgi:hypothetical protein